MTNTERRRAFALRLDGQSWEEIGGTLGYAGNTVYQDLRDCLACRPRRIRTVYPALGRIITERYGGSVRAFSLDCGVSPRAMYDILPGRKALPPDDAEKIRRTTGLTGAELFREEAL